MALGSKAEHGKHVGFLDFIAAKTNELVERGFGVAHSTIRAAGDGVECGWVNFYFFLLRDFGEVLRDERGGDTTQVESLAAGEDGRQDFFRVRGGEHEFHVRGRFLKRLEQGVEGRSGKHVNFVDDIDFELGIRRGVFAGLAQFAHLFHAIVAGAVNFQYVERAAFGNFLDVKVFIVELHFWAASAVQALGKDAGDGGFAGAARAAKERGVGDAFLLDGIGQCPGDVLLADNVREPLWAILSGDDLIAHKIEIPG